MTKPQTDINYVGHQSAYKITSKLQISRNPLPLEILRSYPLKILFRLLKPWADLIFNSRVRLTHLSDDTYMLYFGINPALTLV